ncbi:Uma2 family endonuclease, partial [Moorena sp. SIO3H5]|uniref:Uma2 family endonuclease n=1 Tax=Moorena sp. SIO3H5 TaxID=2607834 RepID=UPI0013BBBA9C
MVQIPAIPETENLQIELPRSIGLSITLEQFVELEAANRDLRLERTAKGELIVNPPTGWETGNRNGRINQQLFNWADVDGTGIAFESSTGFTLPNGAIRSPDASWVSQKRFLMQSLMGETNGSRSWGEPPRPRCLP